jgi:hypothetical protein
MSILNWKNKVLGYTAQMGGGGSSGGGGTTQQSNQYSQISPWAQPYVSSLLGAAQNQIFDTQATPAVAATPATYDSEGNVINPGTPGTPAGTQITGVHPYTAYGYQGAGMSAADQAAAQSAVAGFTPLQQQAYQGAGNLQLPNQFGQATGAAGMGTMQSLMAGQNLANQSTNPNAVGAYMNPYIQNALNPALQLANQQYGIAGTQSAGQATGAGAFGGSRSALQQNLNAQNQMLAQNQLIGNAYNTAYTNAQNQMNTVANVGLQGANQGIAGAGQLGNLGTSQLAAQQGILGLQNQFGGQQQQQAQNVINAGMTNYQTAMQYPMTQLQQLSALAAPYVTKDVTTTQQQAQPSTATQLAGLGTAGVAGLALASKAAKGGLMKGYAGGGITALNRKALLAPDTISPQALQRSTQDGAIAPQVSGIAKAIQLNEQVNGKNAAAMSQPAPQGTIMDELQSKADQMDQAETMQDAIPKALAVLKHKMDQAIEEGDIPLAKKYAAELQQLTQIAQGQQTPSAPAPEGIQQVAPQAGQMAQAEPQQGIDAAPSNLPEQTMAQGGIVGYASGGSAKVLQEADDEETLRAEESYGTGVDNDFIQSIMPAAEGRSAHPSAAISIRTEEGPVKGAKGTHKYEADVIKEAKRVGLPPEIAVHSLYKETGNLKDPETARSRAGALGVMQLMPATAKELGVNPLNPMENIQGGVGYLKKLYDKYQDPQLTLMAYNAGPGRVDRALRSKEGIRSLPHETLAYRMAAGGQVKSYAAGDLISSDAAFGEYGAPDYTVPRSQGELRAQEQSYAPLTKPADTAINQAQIDKWKKIDAEKSAANRTYAAGPVNGTTDAELGRTISTATTESPAPKSFMDQLAEEMMQDIRSRKEESKKTREQNNLLALAQLGLGMAGSKNIHPMGAIAEGGQQALGALAQYRKQEGEEAKDIGAQQLGIYRFGAAAEQNKVLNEIKNAQLGLKQSTSGEKNVQAARDDLMQFEKTRLAALKSRFPMGEMDPKYGAALAEIYKDPKYTALERIAYPNLATTPSTGASNVIKFDAQGNPIKG